MAQSVKNSLWIARDANNSLFIYYQKPNRSGAFFYSEDYYEPIEPGDDLYPELTFENSPKQLILS